MGKIAELKDNLGYSELDTNLDYKVRDPISRNQKAIKHICRLQLRLYNVWLTYQSSEFAPQDPVKLGMVAHTAVLALGRQDDSAWLPGIYETLCGTTTTHKNAGVDEQTGQKHLQSKVTDAELKGWHRG